MKRWVIQHYDGLFYAPGHQAQVGRSEHHNCTLDITEAKTFKTRAKAEREKERKIAKLVQAYVEVEVEAKVIGPVPAPFDHTNPLDIVRHYAGVIQNGRNIGDIFIHGEKEMVELNEEIGAVYEARPAGPDGVVGEAIDVIACMLDVIFVHRPETTNEEIAEITLRKCEKWARRYKDSVDGDRSID